MSTEIEVAGVPHPVAEAVRTVYQQCGGEDFARHILAAACPAESPLHGYFDWDDSTAAEAWRIEQATQLVRRVRVKVIRSETPEPIVVRAYVARRELPPRPEDDGTPTAGGYMAIEEIAGATDWEASVLQEITRDVDRLKRKYRHVHDFFNTVLVQVLDEEDHSA